jgi:predicted O-linked N-acetylglucosamine transferase (SPINDLY family)
MYLCDWRDLEAECARLITSIRNGNAASLPFPVLAMESTPADQLKCAQICAADRYSTVHKEGENDRFPSHDRLRIAYLSADFQNHATAQLAAGLFEHHDRSRFMTTAISFGLDDGSAMRARLRNAFDRFVDVSTKSARETANLLREMEIDIAVDLGGYTQRSRTAIVAMRPAPVQVSYLGYPGTMGAPFIDYIIADEIVIPKEHRAFYSEKIAYLPHSYQCNDSKRHISDKKITRAEAGLPDNVFVFCSFNNSYKITPEVFSVWMKLLQQVDGSVLWLLAGNDSSPINLKVEAEKRGVSSDRLIFAPKVAVEVHLARHRVADLFLDTLPYNAHTTASDALWGGLPVLTCLGSTFAGRVAASLLTATGIPELITPSLDDYEALALRLAREPAMLASIKAKLASNRDACSLFDTARFTRHIETAYGQMWERRRRGEPPATFAVED